MKRSAPGGSDARESKRHTGPKLPAMSAPDHRATLCRPIKIHWQPDAVRVRRVLAHCLRTGQTFDDADPRLFQAHGLSPERRPADEMPAYRAVRDGRPPELTFGVHDVANWLWAMGFDALTIDRLARHKFCGFWFQTIDERDLDHIGIRKPDQRIPLLAWAHASRDPGRISCSQSARKQ